LCAGGDVGVAPHAGLGELVQARGKSYSLRLHRITTGLVAGIDPINFMFPEHAPSPVHSIRHGPVGLSQRIVESLHASLPVHLMRQPFGSTHVYPLLPEIVLMNGVPPAEPGPAWVVGK
jgi:hypothetical protein